MRGLALGVGHSNTLDDIVHLHGADAFLERLRYDAATP